MGSNYPGFHNICVKDKTYLRLLRCKKTPGESFDSVIDRALDGDVDERKD